MLTRLLFRVCTCGRRLLQRNLNHFSGAIPLVLESRRIHGLSEGRPAILSWEGTASSAAARKLEAALRDSDPEAAWEAFRSIARLKGVVDRRLLSRMLAVFSYSPRRQWLGRAHEVVCDVHRQKPGLLNRESLTQLALALARAQMPVHASTVLRIGLDADHLPPTDALRSVFVHLVRSPAGSSLAADVLVEICAVYSARLSRTRNVKRMAPAKPTAAIFNLVLGSCASFGSTMKAREIIATMSAVGVTADAVTVVHMARIYEIAGQRNELRSLRTAVDSLRSPSVARCLYRQFYESLLRLHFDYNDIDAAIELMLHLHHWPADGSEAPRFHFIQIGSGNLKSGFKIMFNLSEICDSIAVGADDVPEPRLVIASEGKLLPSHKAIAELTHRCAQDKKPGELACFLAELSPAATACSDVVAACIQVGWLDFAHDVLDNLESSRSSLLYESLLKGSSFSEALEEEIRKSHCRSHQFHELNDSIRFFCEAAMMDDAVKTLRCMREKRVRPTSQTFEHLVAGFSAQRMHKEVSVLWAEMKREMAETAGSFTPSSDMLSCLLLNFIRGGYFGRALEIIKYMSEHGNVADRWKLRKEFLEHHRVLYRNLRAEDARTDAQRERLEHVKAFRKWAGICRR